MNDTMALLMIPVVVVVGTLLWFCVAKPLLDFLAKVIAYVILGGLCFAFWPLLVIVLLYLIYVKIGVRERTA